MGWRFWCGVGILGTFLAVGLWINGSAERLCSSVCDDLEQAVRAADAGEEEKAAQGLQQAKTGWQRRRQLAMTLADHRIIEQIDGIFAQVEGYLTNGRAVDAAAWCRRLIQLVGAVGDEHRLNLENLL